MPLTVRARIPTAATARPYNSGVGGVQMAEVEVDSETGIVKVKKM